jgi:hypothetical protein
MLTVLEAAASTDLTTLETARAEVGGTTDDAALAALIRQASAACARYCNRPHFAREQYAQTAQWAGPFILERDLAPTIEAVSANGTALTTDDWQLDGAVVSRPGVACHAWGWPYGYPLTVTYRAGFDLLGSLPDDIERAALTVIRAWWFGRGRDPTIRSMSSEGIGMTQYATASAGAAGLPAEAAAMLAPWRRLPGF